MFRRGKGGRNEIRTDLPMDISTLPEETAYQSEAAPLC